MPPRKALVSCCSGDSACFQLAVFYARFPSATRTELQTQRPRNVMAHVLSMFGASSTIKSTAHVKRAAVLLQICVASNRERGRRPPAARAAGPQHLRRGPADHAGGLKLLDAPLRGTPPRAGDGGEAPPGPADQPAAGGGPQDGVGPQRCRRPPGGKESTPPGVHARPREGAGALEDIAEAPGMAHPRGDAARPGDPMDGGTARRACPPRGGRQSPGTRPSSVRPVPP